MMMMMTVVEMMMMRVVLMLMMLLDQAFLLKKILNIRHLPDKSSSISFAIYFDPFGQVSNITYVGHNLILESEPLVRSCDISKWVLQ